MRSQIIPLIVVDVASVLLITSLIMKNMIPLYPGVAIFYPLLFGGNVLWIFLASRSRQGVQICKDGQHVPKSLWIIATIFSLAGIAAVVAYLDNRIMPLGVQAAVAVLLVGYIWFMIYRLIRSRHNQSSN